MKSDKEKIDEVICVMDLNYLLEEMHQVLREATDRAVADAMRSSLEQIFYEEASS